MFVCTRCVYKHGVFGMRLYKRGVVSTHTGWFGLRLYKRGAVCTHTG